MVGPAGSGLAAMTGCMLHRQEAKGPGALAKKLGQPSSLSTKR